MLALNLVKEANPQISDLDKVPEGDRIWAPPLTKETLLRQQPDGSYRLIFASFRKRREAEHVMRMLLAHGYTAVVLPQQVSSNLMLYRVEIEKLQDTEVIEKTWRMVLTQDLSPLIRSKGKTLAQTGNSLSPELKVGAVQ
jgi:hypothetical protein